MARYIARAPDARLASRRSAQSTRDSPHATFLVRALPRHARRCSLPAAARRRNASRSGALSMARVLRARGARGRKPLWIALRAPRLGCGALFLFGSALLCDRRASAHALRRRASSELVLLELARLRATAAPLPAARRQHARVPLLRGSALFLLARRACGRAALRPRAGRGTIIGRAPFSILARSAAARAG